MYEREREMQAQPVFLVPLARLLQGGLVVLNAKYGTLEAIRLAESQELQGPTENGVQANGDYAGPHFSPTQASSETLCTGC